MKKGLFGLNGFASVVVFIFALALIAAIVVFSTVGSVITVDPAQAPAEAAVSDYQHGSNINRSGQTSGKAVNSGTNFVSYINSNTSMYLTADFSVDEGSFGNTSTYSGTIYGNGHTVTLNVPTEVEGYSSTAQNFAGGIIGILTGKLYDCKFVLQGGQYISGLKNSNANPYFGGLIGNVQGGTVDNISIEVKSGVSLANYAWDSDNYSALGILAGYGVSAKITNVTVVNNGGEFKSGYATNTSVNWSNISTGNTLSSTANLVGFYNETSQTVDNIIIKGSGSTLSGKYVSNLGLSTSVDTRITTTNFYNSFLGTLSGTNNGVNVTYVKHIEESTFGGTSYVGSVSVTNYFEYYNSDSDMVKVPTNSGAQVSNRSITEKLSVQTTATAEATGRQILFNPAATDYANSLVLAYTGRDTSLPSSVRTWKVRTCSGASYTGTVSDGAVIFTNLPVSSVWNDKKWGTGTYSGGDGIFTSTLSYEDDFSAFKSADLKEYEHGYYAGSTPSGTGLNSTQFFNMFVNKNSTDTHNGSGTYYLTEDAYITGFTGRDFRGTLDGNGKTVYIVGAQTGLEGDSIGGIIGELNGGTVKNLRVVICVDVNVKTSGTVPTNYKTVGIGGVVGNITGNSLIENVNVVINQGVTFSTSNNTANAISIGGISGNIFGKGRLNNCTVQLDGTMSCTAGYAFISGIVGNTGTPNHSDYKEGQDHPYMYSNIVLKGGGQFTGKSTQDTSEPMFSAALTITDNKSSAAQISIDGFIYALTNSDVVNATVSCYGYVSQNKASGGVSSSTAGGLPTNGYITAKNVFTASGCTMTPEYSGHHGGNNSFAITTTAAIPVKVEGDNGIDVMPYFKPQSTSNLTLVANTSSATLKLKDSSTTVATSLNGVKTLDVAKSSATFTLIKPASVPQITGSYTYTGSEITPQVNVTYNGTALDPSNYSLSYGSIINAGNYDVTTTLLNGYYFYNNNTVSFGYTSSLYVARADMQVGVSVTGWTYGTEPTDPVFTGRPEEATDYTLLYEGNTLNGGTYSGQEAPTDAGTYTLTVTFRQTANYNGTTVSTSFNVSAALVTLKTTTVERSFGTVNENNFNDPTTYPPIEFNGLDGATYTVSLNTDGATWIQDNKRTEYLAAGKYTLTVTLSGGNYKLADGADTVSVTVTENADANSFVEEYARAGWTYYSKPTAPTDAVARFGTPEVKYYSDPERLVPAEEFTNLTPAGTYYYTVTVEGTDSYNALSANGSFEVSKLEVGIALSAAEAVYTGAEYSLDSVTVTLTGADGMDYSDDRNTLLGTVSWKINQILTPVEYFPADAGRYELGIYSITNDANITVKDGLGSVTAIIVIKPATVSFSAELNTDKSIIYGDEISDFKDFATVTADIEGFEDWTYTAAAEDYTSSTNAGSQVTVTVTVSINNNNYALSDGSRTAVFELKTTVQKADIELNIVIDGGSYTGAAKEAQVTGQPDEVTLKTEYYSVENDIYTLLDAAPKDAGSYAVRVTVSGAANYNDYDSGYISYTILKAAVSFTVSIDDWTYGGTGTPTITGLKPDVAEIQNAIQFTYNGTTFGGLTYESGEIPSQAGKYTVTATYPVSDNYEDYTAYDNFEIAKADPVLKLTINESLTYNAEDQTVTYTLSGHKENGTVSEFKITDAEGKPVENGRIRKAGVYTATAIGSNTANYKEFKVSAKFTVEQKELQISNKYAKGTQIEFGSLRKNNHSSPTSYLGIVEGIYNADNYEGHSVYKLALDVSDSDFAEDCLIVKQEGYTLTVTVTNGNYTFADGSSSTVKVEVTQAKNGVTSNYSRSDWTYYDPASTDETKRVFKFGNDNVQIKYYKDAAYTSEYTGSLNYSTPAGTYYVKIYVEDTVNYSYAETTGSFTVNKREVTVTVKADKSVFEYGDAIDGISIAYGDLGSYGDDVFGTTGYRYSAAGEEAWTDGLPEQPDVGKYVIEFTYTNTANVVLADSVTSVYITVEPKPVTFTVSVADGAIYGMNLAEVEALVNIETTAELEYGKSITVSAGDAKYDQYVLAGTEISIAVSITVTDTNYIASVTGDETKTLFVKKAPLTVTAKDKSILRADTYDYQDLSAIYDCFTVEGLRNEHTFATLFVLTSEPGDFGKFSVDSYTVTASLNSAEDLTANYEIAEGSDTKMLFTLSIDSYEMSVSIKGWTYGEEANKPVPEGFPLALGPSMQFNYKGKTYSGTDYDSSQAPSEAGAYTLTVTIPATSEYTAGEASYDFVVSQREIGVSATATSLERVFDADNGTSADAFYEYLSVTNVVQGDTVESIFAVVLKNAVSEEINSIYSAGEYSVSLNLINLNYTVSGDMPVIVYSVTKAKMSVGVSIKGWTYGSAPVTPVVNGIMEKAKYAFTYNGTDNSSQPYSSADAPENAGVYTLTVTVDGTENYNGTEVTSDSFTVSRQSITSRVSILGWVYGQYDANKNAPFVTSNPGKGDVKYTYAVYGTDEFVSAVPENAGSYTVKAVIAETANYTEAYATLDFEIEKASIAPGIASVTGSEYSGNAALVNLISGSNPGSAAVTYYFERLSGEEWLPVSEAVYAGSYRVKAEVAASDNYFGGITEYFEFAVSAKEIIYTWSLTDDKIVYGDSLDMVLGSVVYDETGILASFVERDRGYVTFTASALVDGALYTPAVNAGSSVIFSLAVALDAEKAGADVSDSYIITLSAPAVDSKEVAVKQIAIDADSFSNVYGNSYTEDISLGEYFGGYFAYNGESVNALEDGVNTVEYTISSDSVLLPNAGSYIVTVSVSGNYSGEAELTYVIEKAVIALNSDYEFAFGYLNAANIADKGVYGSLILGLIGGESVDYALSAATDADDLYADYLKVNSYTVTVTLPDDVNYIFADGIYASFVVNVVKGENEWVSEFVRDDWTYLSEPSEAVMPVARFDAEYVSVKYYSDPEYTNELGEDGFAPGIPAGVYYAVATVGGTENYGALRGEYTFEVLKLNAIVSVSTPDAEFDGEPYDGIGYSVSGADASVMGEVSWKYSADGGATFTNGLPTDAGHYIIRVDGIANESVTVYNGYENFYLTVNPKQIEFKVRLNDFTVYYGDEIDPTELIAEPVPASDECGSFSYSVKAVNGIGVEYYAGMLAKSKIILNVSIDIDDSNYVAFISSGEVSFVIQPKEIKPEIVVEEAVVADGNEISIANGYEYTVIDAIKNYMAETGVKHYDYDIFVNGARYSASETTWEPGEYTVSVSLSGNHSGSMEIKMTVEENADYATVSVREPLTPVGEFLNTINLNMAGALAILFAFIVSVVVILFFGLRRKNK